MGNLKTTLVAGGAGFIGSHLIQNLLCEPNKVICIDNLCTGSKENLSSFFNNENFTFIESNINTPLNLDIKIDEIYNLASPASPLKYQGDPIFTVTTNFIGVKNLLDLASKNKSRFFQASTSEIYGDPREHPQRETYYGNVNPIGIRACYDEGKRVAETLCFDYHRQLGIDIRIIRIFNTYGPKMKKDDGRVISNFINQALSNEGITVYGDGSQTRSFQYVDDLILGMVKMMEQDKDTGPVNIGNPEEYTILQIAQKIISLTGSKSKIINLPLPKDDPVKRKPDIAKAKNLLNWEPKISLEEGLKKTIDYFR